MLKRAELLMSPRTRRSLLLVLVVVATAVGAGGCPQPAAPGTVPPAPVARSTDERRLAVKIAALQKLREEMQSVLGELEAEAERAEALNVRLEELKGRLGEDRVARELEAVRAARREEEPAPAAGPLTARRRLEKLEATATKLLAAEPVVDGDPATVRMLKAELASEQELTTAVVAAGRLGRQALAHVEELDGLVERLQTAE